MQCRECRAEFTPSSHNQAFCCRPCCKRFHKRIERAKNRKPSGWNVATHDAPCNACGRPLPSPRHASRRCCDRCRKLGTPLRRARVNAKRRLRLATDHGYLLRKRLSCRLRELCSKRGLQKRNSITAYLGCSPHDLMRHIEAQFTNGMSWQNYGVHGWHVDHHIPCAAFDLSKESHRAVCFHFSNLRPLPAHANAMKQATLHNDIPATLKTAAFAVGVLVL